MLYWTLEIIHTKRHVSWTFRGFFHELDVSQRFDLKHSCYGRYYGLIKAHSSFSFLRDWSTLKLSKSLRLWYIQKRPFLLDELKDAAWIHHCQDSRRVCTHRRVSSHRACQLRASATSLVSKGIWGERTKQVPKVSEDTFRRSGGDEYRSSCKETWW